MQVAVEQQVWVSPGTPRAMPRPLPGRLAVPLIAAICLALWAGIFAMWGALG